ncbi:MAG: response regulator [Deltaproteobacteria bacterium]|nr:response regulator [Deltaproteobacteria bacterium]
MGTKFHVYLPVAEGKAVEDSKTPEQFPTGTETILLVDDEKLNVFSYTTLLEDQGYTVEGFTESLKAYEAFISNPEKYNLILTDYTMPDLTGLKLADKIREQNFKIPVVLITGLSEAISDDDLEQVQIKKILSKPIDLYDLAVAVRNALDEQTQVAETLT